MHGIFYIFIFRFSAFCHVYLPAAIIDAFPSGIFGLRKKKINFFGCYVLRRDRRDKSIRRLKVTQLCRDHCFPRVLASIDVSIRTWWEGEYILSSIVTCCRAERRNAKDFYYIYRKYVTMYLLTFLSVVKEM